MTIKERLRRVHEKAKPAYDALMKLYPLTTDDLDGEEWLPVPDWECYHVSNFGRMKSFKGKSPHILTPTFNRGYLQIGLCSGGKQKTFRVHRLVAELFIPNPDNKNTVNHRDGHKLNNHISNLEWATSTENNQHAARLGLIPSAEDSPDAKLTKEQVLYIRNNPDNLTQRQLADLFGLIRQTIGQIQLGKSWKYVGGVIRQRCGVPDDVRKQIRAEYVFGSHEFNSHTLAKKYGVTKTTILNIVHEN